MWAIGIWRPMTRTARFIAFMAVLSLIYVVAGSVPGSTAPIRILVVGAWGIAILMPQHLRLGAQSESELRMDEAIREAVERLSGAASPEDPLVEEVLGDLNRIVPPDESWKRVRDLYVDSIIQWRTSEGRGDPASVADAVSAATVAWRQARERRVLIRKR